MSGVYSGIHDIGYIGRVSQKSPRQAQDLYISPIIPHCSHWLICICHTHSTQGEHEKLYMFNMLFTWRTPRVPRGDDQRPEGGLTVLEHHF